MAETYLLLIHRAEGVSKLPGALLGKPKLYTTVYLHDYPVLTTHIVEGTLSPQWMCIGNIASVYRSTILIGECHTTVADLLKQSGANTSTTLDMKRKTSVSGRLIVCLDHALRHSTSTNEVSVNLSNSDSIEPSSCLPTDILAKFRYLTESDLLKQLKPAQYNASLHEECLGGTRQTILTKLIEGLTSSQSNITWLVGKPGTGKSTIAYTVAQHFRTSHQIGAFVFFARDDSKNSNVLGVLHHIAHRVAESNIRARKALCDVLAADATLIYGDYQEQFQKLLVDPFEAAGPYIGRPVVIIIDALDECLDPASRRALVSLIAVDMKRLHPAFRLLITSRPDLDIVRALSSQSHITAHQLEIGTEDATRDIQLYLRQRMRELSERCGVENPRWPAEHDLQLLANFTGGLFINAVTACNFVGGFNPPRRLQQLLDAGPEWLHTMGSS
ncbi:hypothetical protein R3P38DRAFT_3284437 [Favolaschia claudopus]|uniref:NACHT domain-containing protein n=1 Tax=Favolaschia claudopus TaxID=2862362 RepID=A0AAW0A5K5_9AGAR